MSKKKKGETLETLNKGFKVPDTYVIIFFVVCFAALLTYLIPQGMYETQEVSYMIDGAESTRTVIKDNSFQYVLDANGEPLKKGVGLFEAGGGVGLLNYLKAWSAATNGVLLSASLQSFWSAAAHLALS